MADWNFTVCAWYRIHSSMHRHLDGCSLIYLFVGWSCFLALHFFSPCSLSLSSSSPFPSSPLPPPFGHYGLLYRFGKVVMYVPLLPFRGCKFYILSFVHRNPKFHTLVYSIFVCNLLWLVEGLPHCNLHVHLGTLKCVLNMSFCVLALLLNHVPFCLQNNCSGFCFF